MPIPNNIDFTAFDILTAAQMDDLVENDTALAAGTALDTNAIPARALATNAITLDYKEYTTAGAGTGNTTDTLVTGLASTVTIPAGTRKILATAYFPSLQGSGAMNVVITIWNAATPGTNRLTEAPFTFAGANYFTPLTAFGAIKTPAAGSQSYCVGFRVSSGTVTVNASATSPAFLLIQAI